MTKNNEEIIIDGVDVSGCDELHINEANTIICEITGYLCDDRQNCYYKQLKYLEKAFDYREKTYLTNLNNLADEAKFLREKLHSKEQECDNLQGEISHYEHDLGWCSSLIDLYEEKLMKTFYALQQIQLHNRKIKDKDIDLILKEVKEDLKEYNKMKNEELDKKVKDE